MTRCLHLAFLIVSLTLLAGGVSLADEEQQEAVRDGELLRGSWRVVAAKDEGRDKPAAIGQLDLFDSAKLHVISPHGRRTVYRYELEAGAKPKRMILLTDDDLFSQTAIYKFEKGLLTLCYSYEPGVTPTEFVTKPKSGLVMLTLKRDLDH